MVDPIFAFSEAYVTASAVTASAALDPVSATFLGIAGHAELAAEAGGWPLGEVEAELDAAAYVGLHLDLPLPAEAARARLGDAFDLKRWHTATVALGPLGLSTFAEAVRSR